MTGTGEDRAAAFGIQLVRAHNALRERLQTLQAGLDDPVGSGGGAELFEHCLAFCAALTDHHVGEDDGLFAALRTARPDLGPVIDLLVQDHGLIGSILLRVRALADEAGGASSERRAAIGRELDGLAAIMDSHFAFEERRIANAIDGLRDDGWGRSVFTPVGLTSDYHAP